MVIKKRKIFLLNNEQKILVFIDFEKTNFAPQLYLPFYGQIFDIKLERFEYVTEIKRERERLEAVNNRLKRTTYTVQNLYYTITCELTKNMKMDINNFCLENGFIPEFLSIEEIEDALWFVKENYEEAREQDSLKKSLKVLKRKLDYEEY